MTYNKLIKKTIRLLYSLIEDERLDAKDVCNISDYSPPHFMCTRVKDHKGPHIATGPANTVYRIWE